MIEKGFKTSAIGIMSGTSLDGLDICFVEFEFTNRWQFKIIASHCVDYDENWRNLLKTAHQLPTQALDKLDARFGEFIGKQTNQFLERFELGKPELICSHGHTVFHDPSAGLTKQIGCGRTIADETRITTISDFRSLDVSLGGQGAPLVPIGDKLLFDEFDSCLNIGGFANISYDKNGERIAFDICPVNIILNNLASELGMSFDKDGAIAYSNEVDERLLQQLHHSMPNSKHSLAREWLEESFLPILSSSSASSETKISTSTRFAAEQIAQTINDSTPTGRVLITGGGAYNKALINAISGLTKASVIIPETQIIEFKEALVFAFLGVLKSLNEINVLRSVTGASEDTSSGVIHLAKP